MTILLFNTFLVNIPILYPPKLFAGGYKTGTLAKNGIKSNCILTQNLKSRSHALCKCLFKVNIEEIRTSMVFAYWALHTKIC